MDLSPGKVRPGCISRTIIFLALIALSAASALAYPIKVKDARGKTVSIKAKPVRIVSINPATTEIAFALGLGKRVVGVTRMCNYPPEAKSRPNVGDVTTSVEAVAVLKPDLVLAHAFVNDAAIPRLERLGLTVFAVDPKTLGQVIRDIRALGKITCRPKTADSLARKMEKDIAAVKASRRGKPVKRVLVVIEASQLWVAGPKTFVDEMIQTANAENVAYDARPGFNTFSKELAIQRNPDVIIVGVKEDADFMVKSPIWQTTNAVKNHHVCVIPGDLTVRPGPRLVEGLKALAAKL